MKVIFLDVDGVLNSYKYMRKPTSLKATQYQYLDKKNIKYLKEIVVQTNAMIVLSSSWRWSFDNDLTSHNTLGRSLLSALKEAGLSLYDKTPFIEIDRYQEIKEWLRKHPEVTNYIILDDVNFHWRELEKHWVYCNPKVGLRKKDVQQAITLLED